MAKIKDEGYTPIVMGVVFVALVVYRQFLGDGHWLLWLPIGLFTAQLLYLIYIVRWFRKQNPQKREAK